MTVLYIYNTLLLETQSTGLLTYKIYILSIAKLIIIHHQEERTQKAIYRIYQTRKSAYSDAGN